MKRGTKLGLNQLLTLIKSGKSPSVIAKDNHIPKQTLQYNVDKLKALGCIEKEGYGVWKFIKEIPKRPKDTTAPNFGTREIRGHAFIWKIDFLGDGFNWLEIVKRYKKRYKRPKLTFQFLARGKVPRTIFRNRKVWLTKGGMIIYEPISFMGKSSFQVKGNAVFEMDSLVKGLLKELRLKFKHYRFTTSREHYAQVKNELARQHNDRKEKMIIKDEYGTVWLWVDNSSIKGFKPGEMETADPLISRNVQTFWNSNRKHGFKIDADFIANSFNQTAEQIQQNATQLDYYGKNVVKHVALMESIDKNLGKQTALFEQIALSLKETKKKD